MIGVYVVGKTGKTGSAVAKLAEEDPELILSDDPDVVVDFSTPEGTREAIAMGKPLVSGTTGLEKGIFEELSKSVPVLHSPNFSPGMHLLFSFLEMIEKKGSPFSEVAISEVHHVQKKDSPSGTALKMADLLSVPKEKVDAKREGEEMGQHSVTFSSPWEKLSIDHKVFSREAFAHGALCAVKFLIDKQPGIYTLDDVFG